ncbi:uncharacterized protein L3040_005409 [Drepanopeziza brunnea f. sp. 'multigermtubi']|uniref:Aquaporin n=1 Tax=Marssonina brunnea f. sp. multigermtubi (strain MB_m1) TaxID=1072389 RepID=K1WW11_MARBU|nr:aquaporin [Drepanopeziza brunnea f. sp. 'multigermtubi' MB_m1]EKD17191.1 aquaporin [Drepanopeziza brunnea f. sp. 'multigermtubi' MB_m1]KAJ5041843.1 hypothetical protein L3040_005409 [Drepanopeziza brunnea f. sp. 'multigermtubi']
MNNISIPLSYTTHSKSDFVFPRPPPTPGQYPAPILTKVDTVPDRPKNWRLWWISDNVRNHLIAMLGEFIGTLSFLFFSLTAVQTANNKADTLPRADLLSTSPSLLQISYISFSFGISLMVNVWVFYRVSGGMFNPAVTFGLCFAGAVPWIRGALLVPTQMLAGVVASGLVSGLFPGDLKAQVNTSAGVSVSQGLFIEMILTAELVFTILMLAVENHRGSFLAPLGIGLALLLAHLIGINFTGACLNPARGFGPDLILGDFKGYHWIYYIGPLLGAALAALLYKLLKYLEYTTCNPDQDDDGLDVYRVIAGRTHSKLNRRSSIESFSSQAPLA